MGIITKKKSSLISGNSIEDCILVDLKENKDDRGSFTEIFQKKWNTVIDPVQWSMVRSEAGVFRGMHYHKRHDEYFSIIKGSCYLGLKDLRPESATYLKTALYFLCEDDLKALIFPRGVLHGWYFIEPSVHMQSVSESYLDYESEDNYGCRWDAPDLDIDWPFNKALTSKRALQFGDVAALPTFSK
jgi:dTDP-4-dehydrorhamnose 3,5-epimerase